jgi:molybdate transport system substrate-binding protein
MQSLHDFMPQYNRAKRQFLRQSLGGTLALGVRSLAVTSLGVPWGCAMAQAKLPSIRIAAASDLKFALARLVGPFEKQYGVKVELSFGSSGNFARQILQGLPADIFMSADEDWAFKVADAGLTYGGSADRGVLYAQGRLAFIVPRASPISLDPDLKGLRAQWPSVRKFAIANAEHAPYGRAAQQALQKLGMWGSVEQRLVLGESVTQATQFVTAGAAQAGITAWSLAIAPEVSALARYVVLPAQHHAPLRQRMVLLKGASAHAQALYSHLQTAQVQDVLINNGFSAK